MIPMSIFAFSTPEWMSLAWAIIVAIGAIAAIGGLFLASRKFIVDVVSKEMENESTVRKLSLLIKPDLVFDENGAVLADRGAWAAIKENGIAITKDTNDNPVTKGLPVTIRIAFTKHLPTAPLLTPIVPDVIFVTSTRGAEFEWVYTLKYTLRSDPDDGPIVRTYRLELL